VAKGKIQRSDFGMMFGIPNRRRKAAPGNIGKNNCTAVATKNIASTDIAYPHIGAVRGPAARGLSVEHLVNVRGRRSRHMRTTLHSVTVVVGG
jgi:hypothetical protein